MINVINKINLTCNDKIIETDPNILGNMLSKTIGLVLKGIIDNAPGSNCTKQLQHFAQATRQYSVSFCPPLHLKLYHELPLRHWSVN